LGRPGVIGHVRLIFRTQRGIVALSAPQRSFTVIKGSAS
jgi:hypothetical protein